MSVYDDMVTNFTEKSFDMTSAIAFMLLWVMFAYTTPLLSCATQRMMESSVYPKHMMGIIGFFCLMAITDTKNNTHIGVLWIKSIIGYLFFMMLMKNNMYTFIIILFLLAADISLRVQIDYMKKNNIPEKQIKEYENARNVLFYVVCAIMIVGFGLYAYHAYHNHKQDFSFITFIFGNNTCSKNL
jgi:hypothetical protein